MAITVQGPTGVFQPSYPDIIDKYGVVTKMFTSSFKEYFTSSGAVSYSVNKSLRFRSSASAYLSRTSPATISTYTVSMWVKRGILGSADFQYLFSHFNSGNTNTYGISFEATTDKLVYFNGTSQATTAVYRDPAAWYHIVFSNNAGAFTMYVNGESVKTGTATAIPSSAVMNIARNTIAGAYWFDGEMAEVNFVDGQALAPTAFGAYSTYNQWLPIKYAGTYGTNGFYLPFSGGTATSYAGSFNGSTQYLAYPNNAAFSFGSSNFTIEAWIKVTSTSNYNIYVNSDTSNNLGVTLYAGGGTIHAFVTASPGGNIVYDLQGPASSVVTGVWTHIAFVRSGTTFTAYVNGVAGTPSTNSNAMPPSQARCYIGTSYNAAAGFFSGDISNYRVVNGTAVYTANFIPPTTALTAITNTSLLTLQNATIVDNSTNAFTITNPNTVVTSVQSPFLNPTVLVADSSGNGNNWTPNNISLTAGSTYDSLTDVPTLTSTTVANYAVLNPLDKGANTTLSNGNLSIVGANSGCTATMHPITGKFYWEVTLVDAHSTYFWGTHGISTGAPNYDSLAGAGVFLSTNATYGGLWANGVQVTVYTTFTNGDVIGMAYDATNLTLSVYKNNTQIGSALTVPAAAKLISASQSGDADTSQTNYNFGQQPFTYTPPSGFLPLNTFNI